ncbi:hypothetical protein [Methylobacterium nigriterrae]|uniref:hypothetical protein n=1 Tax=Methylobacterium nigriterrae TaxID=3127512 RepID=UPI003013FFD5
MIEIKHELRMMAAADVLADALRARDCTSLELAETIGDLTSRYNIPPDQARALLTRLERNRAMPASVAR